MGFSWRVGAVAFPVVSRQSLPLFVPEPGCFMVDMGLGLAIGLHDGYVHERGLWFCLPLGHLWADCRVVAAKEDRDGTARIGADMPSFLYIREVLTI